MLTTELLQRKAPHGLVAADRCWVRGDEHLEAFAFLDVLGTKRTKYFLRAVAQRLNRLTEKQAVKYAAKTRNYSQKDVVLLSHPEPKDAKQSALFKYIRHGWDSLTQEEADLLPLIKKIHKHGHTISWEQEISTKGSTTENWENSVGKMGYMALLRDRGYPVLWAGLVLALAGTAARVLLPSSRLWLVVEKDRGRTIARDDAFSGERASRLLDEWRTDAR